MIYSRKKIVLSLSVLALITSSSSQLLGMNQLCFYLNGKRQIESSSDHGNMKFYVEPKEFEGKDILDVLPLSEITRKEILDQFNTATENNTITHANYELENTNYTAEITPLSNQTDSAYFVKVCKK